MNREDFVKLSESATNIYHHLLLVLLGFSPSTVGFKVFQPCCWCLQLHHELWNLPSPGDSFLVAPEKTRLCTNNIYHSRWAIVFCHWWVGYDYVSQTKAYSNCLKLAKKERKKTKTQEKLNKKQISKIQKTQKQNKRKKREKQGRTKRGKNEIVHLHVFCIYFAFYFFSFFPGKKQKKTKKM